MKRVASAAITILLAFAPILFALTIILIFALMVSAAPPRARDEVKLPRARDEVKVPAQPEVVKPAVLKEVMSSVEPVQTAPANMRMSGLHVTPAEQEPVAPLRFDEEERRERLQQYQRSFNPWNFQWGNPSRCLGGS